MFILFEVKESKQYNPLFHQRDEENRSIQTNDWNSAKIEKLMIVIFQHIYRHVLCVKSLTKNPQSNHRS